MRLYLGTAVLVLLCGCGGSQRTATNTAGIGSPLSGLPALPAAGPPAPPRQGSLTVDPELNGNVVDQAGPGYSAAAPNGLLDAQGGISWAIYRFDGVSTSDQFASVSLLLNDSRPGALWIGVSNYSRSRWQWQGINNPSNSPAVPLDAGWQPVNAAGQAYVALAVLGADTASVGKVTLRLVRPGDPPIVSVDAAVATGQAPFAADLTATASDPDGGAITKYEWDWNSDGIYDSDTGATSTATSMGYIQNGINVATVRVTDDEGATATASVQLTVKGWLHTWGVPRETWFFSAVLVNGHIYLAGGSRPTVSGSLQLLIAQLDLQGNIAIAKSYPVGSHASNIQICADPAGNMYVAANDEPTDQEYSIVLARIDENCDMVWAKRWETTTHQGDEVTDLRADASGVYLCGLSEAVDAMGNGLLLHFDPQGNLLWQKDWGDIYFDYFKDLALTPTGNPVVSGVLSLNNTGTRQPVIVTFDTAGQTVWSSTYGKGPNNNFIQGIDIDSNGNIYAAGGRRTSSSITGMQIFKLDSGGGIVWSKTWAGVDDRAASQEVVVVDDSHILIRANGDTPAGDSSEELVEIDGQGSVLRAYHWLESAPESFSLLAVVPGPSGETYLLGMGPSALANPGIGNFQLLAANEPVYDFTPTDVGVPAATLSDAEGTVSSITLTGTAVTGAVIDLPGAQNGHGFVTRLEP